jgi:hypothetical protein
MGYNYAKNKNYKHSDKKIKDYIHKSCSADLDISIKEILQTAADTNFDTEKIQKSKVMLLFELLSYGSTGEGINSTLLKMFDGDQEIVDDWIDLSEKTNLCVINKLDNKEKKYLSKVYEKVEKKLKKTKSYAQTGYLIIEDFPGEDLINAYGGKKKWEENLKWHLEIQKSCP